MAGIEKKWVYVLGPVIPESAPAPCLLVDSERGKAVAIFADEQTALLYNSDYGVAGHGPRCIELSELFEMVKARLDYQGVSNFVTYVKRQDGIWEYILMGVKATES